MPRPKKPTAPAIRVSNALITNILQSMDERILSKIDASEPAKQELRIAGKPINGITPAMHAIMLYIGQKIAEKYADQQELIDRNCKEWAEKGKEQLFKDSFAFSIDLVYKDIFAALYQADKKYYSGGYLKHIAEVVEKLCTMRYCLLFPAKPNKRVTHYGINATLLNKEQEITKTDIFGEPETIGVKVRISYIFMANYHQLKQTTQVPQIALPITMRIDKDDLTQYIFSAITYNSGAKIRNAKREREKGEKDNLEPQTICNNVERALLYSEGFNKIRNKIHIDKYKKNFLFIRALNKTAESLIKNGVITRFYITENSSGEKITNWIINENFSY